MCLTATHFCKKWNSTYASPDVKEAESCSARQRRLRRTTQYFTYTSSTLREFHNFCCERTKLRKDFHSTATKRVIFYVRNISRSFLFSPLLIILLLSRIFHPQYISHFIFVSCSSERKTSQMYMIDGTVS